jgi:hypothetical protein
MESKVISNPEPKFVEYCPDCGSHVYASANEFRCNNGSCNFRIYRNFLNKFGVDKPMPVVHMQRLIQGGCIPLFGLISQKTQEPFDCIAYLDYSEENRRWWIKYDFTHFAIGVFKQRAANKH